MLFPESFTLVDFKEVCVNLKKLYDRSNLLQQLLKAKIYYSRAYLKGYEDKLDLTTFLKGYYLYGFAVAQEDKSQVKLKVLNPLSLTWKQDILTGQTEFYQNTSSRYPVPLKDIYLLWVKDAPYVQNPKPFILPFIKQLLFYSKLESVYKEGLELIKEPPVVHKETFFDLATEIASAFNLNIISAAKYTPENSYEKELSFTDPTGALFYIVYTDSWDNNMNNARLQDSVNLAFLNKEDVLHKLGYALNDETKVSKARKVIDDSDKDRLRRVLALSQQILNIKAQLEQEFK